MFWVNVSLAIGKNLKCVVPQGTLKNTMVKMLLLWYFISFRWPVVVILSHDHWIATVCLFSLRIYPHQWWKVSVLCLQEVQTGCTTSQNQCMSQNIQVLTVIVYFCEKPQFFCMKDSSFQSVPEVVSISGGQHFAWSLRKNKHPLTVRV